MNVVAEKQLILVVEDEPMVAEVVQRYLVRDGYRVAVVSDGRSALETFRRIEPALVLLDIMLPELDGLEVCRIIRAERQTPVILLTARDREADKVNGLALGADDYVTKPFSPRELVARVEAVLRRSGVTSEQRVRPSELSVHGLVINEATRQAAEASGQPLSLTAREFDLLVLFARHPGRVFTREQLLDAIWGNDFDGDVSTVTVHVRRLRTKIEEDPSRPVRLVTVWGVGYRLE